MSHYKARLPSVTYKLIFKKKNANYPGTVQFHNRVCEEHSLVKSVPIKQTTMVEICFNAFSLCNIWKPQNIWLHTVRDQIPTGRLVSQ